MAHTMSLFGTCSAGLGDERSCLCRLVGVGHLASPRGWRLRRPVSKLAQVAIVRLGGKGEQETYPVSLWLRRKPFFVIQLALQDVVVGVLVSSVG